MSDFSVNFQFSPCMHRHVVLVTIGRRRFSQGEVDDDFQDLLQCTDCLEYVTEEEVRGAWNGVSLQKDLSSLLADDFEEDIFSDRKEVKEWQHQTVKESFSIPRLLLHKHASAPK